MRQSKIRKVLLLFLILILMVTVGGTLAYLQKKTQNVVNTFTIGNVTTQVTEEFSQIDDWEFQKCPRVENIGYNGEGNACYVRVYITASPEEQLNLIGLENYEDDWVKGEDGYYYYQHVLEVGESTTPIFDSIEVKEAYRDTIEEFEVTVYQEAVQCSISAKDGTKEEDMMAIWAAYESGKLEDSFETQNGADR